MPGTLDIYQDDYDYGDNESVESFMDVKQSHKQKARARRMLEEKLERKMLRKRLQDFYDED